MPHDRRYKTLLEGFARDFLAAFVPDLAAALDDSPLEPIDPATRGQEPHARDRLPDLVLRGRMKGEEAWFLIHIEAQHRHQPDLPARMYAYWVRLRARHDRPVFPIAFLTHARPRKASPDVYEEVVAGRRVARFEYQVVQLSALRWQDFIALPNPVAAALLVQMGVASADRVRVKWESWMRLLALPLSREERRFLVGLTEAYSPLTPDQDAEFRARVDALQPPLKEVLMTEWTNSWMEEGKQKGLEQGLQEGRHEGALRAALRLLGRRVGLPGPEVQARLAALPAEALEDLVEAAIDFAGPADLVAWLDAR
ncbi:MAG: DUF4351 domain-containing protein [Candidatus Sericytochromatia bacterium]|nr:DUF4351 domain-containing protein [Candidatus Sericytochromatia bacterium]